MDVKVSNLCRQHYKKQQHQYHRYRHRHHYRREQQNSSPILAIEQESSAWSKEECEQEINYQEQKVAYEMKFKNELNLNLKHKNQLFQKEQGELQKQQQQQEEEHYTMKINGATLKQTNQIETTVVGTIVSYKVESQQQHRPQYHDDFHSHHGWCTWRNIAWKSSYYLNTITATVSTAGNLTHRTQKQLSWRWFAFLLLLTISCIVPTATSLMAMRAAASTVTANTITTTAGVAAAAAAIAAVTTMTTARSHTMFTTTYEPLLSLEFQIGEANAEEDGEDREKILKDSVIAKRRLQKLINSNEEQLLEYFERAQHQHQQQDDRIKSQFIAPQHRHHHHNHQRDVPQQTLAPPLVQTPQSLPLASASLPADALSVSVDFDDIVPTAGIVSTLSPSSTTAPKQKTNASKRSVYLSEPHLTTSVSSSSSTLRTTTTFQPDSVTAEDEKCEPKVLEEVPSLPFYDCTDIVEDAARQFTEFLSIKFPTTTTNPLQQQPQITDELRDEVRRRANSIATYALNEDENLLAFAIAAPSIHTVVVKFRDNVTVPPDQVHNRGFLGSYWRELGYAWNSSDGDQEWGAPFRDCNLMKGRWLWPFRISFTEFKIKIVAAAFIAADEDVCNDSLEEVFGRKHGCDRNTTFCLLLENKPAATRDVYTCICRESFYLPNSTVQGFRGDIVEMSEGFDNYSCLPCPGGCTNCDQNGVCAYGDLQESVSIETLLKLSVGSVLGACILCCVVLSIIVFRQRKCKAIASGMWTVLEIILLGIVLLYTSVVVHFFPASTERCLTEPWLRELGFITCYGAIILKLYRHLVDFRTRKAHRWVLRDVDLLKYLGTMVFAVICYMTAYTASSMDLLEIGQWESLREARTNTCHPLKWEVVTQTSELLILCFGLHLAYTSRNATTQFQERYFLVGALFIEFLVSGIFYFLRFFYLPEMSPGAILLALFIRSQLTNTVTLGLIFVPKLWYQHKQVRSLAYDLSIRLPVDAFKGSHDAGQRLGGGYAGLCLGDPDIGELTISEMSPEDIRAELKRLYTQLEILKNKTLRQDNPHISKRRGGRKAGHRRFSLQALSAKHRSNKHHQDIEITEAEPSRTPEDSVCSVEGPTDTYAEISGISHSMLSHSFVSHSMMSHSK